MAENEKATKSGISPDWFMRGALTKIGDTLDAVTGRRWVPSSTLATSELVERMKLLLDSEAKDVEGKGLVVPHNIKLKMQWDKFSTDSETALESLKNDLLAAAADHINDSLYYTYAPLAVEVRPDYFTEGVKLFVGFDNFSEEEAEAEMNVTITGVQLRPPDTPKEIAGPISMPCFEFKYTLKATAKTKEFNFPHGRRVSIGRTSNNDLFINDTSISKIHASLTVNSDAELAVADTGSTNGTFINGERIPYGKALVLNDGDLLKFGSVEVSFERLEKVDEVPIEKPEDDGSMAIGGLKLRSRETVLDVDSGPLSGEETAKLGTPSEEMSRAETQPNLPDIATSEGSSK